ncbi:MAG: hypothetical protein JEZ03_06195 [Bacteroidales bacterium]|nr:hypothetical protein [Bacteroidales bacterium]
MAQVRKSRGVKRFFLSLLDGSYLRDETFTKQLPFIIYLVTLGFLLIYSRNDYEKKAMQIIRLDKEIKELRFEFIDTRSMLMTTIQQSQIARKLKVEGVEESVVPPGKIYITDNE